MIYTYHANIDVLHAGSGTTFKTELRQSLPVWNNKHPPRSIRTSDVDELLDYVLSCRDAQDNQVVRAAVTALISGLQDDQETFVFGHRTVAPLLAAEGRPRSAGESTAN